MSHAPNTAESKGQDMAARIRDLAKNCLTLEELEGATATAIVERLVKRLEITTRSNSLLDQRAEELLGILSKVTGSLLEVKFVATTLITSRNPDVCLNDLLIHEKARGWKLRSERALREALPYCPEPKAPSHREPLPDPVITGPEKKPNPIRPASKAVDLSKDNRGRR